MLLGALLAIGLYALSRQRERGEEPNLLPTLGCWRGNISSLAIFALVIGVVAMIWARASMMIFALVYTAPIAGHATWHTYRDLIGAQDK